MEAILIIASVCQRWRMSYLVRASIASPAHHPSSGGRGTRQASSSLSALFATIFGLRGQPFKCARFEEGRFALRGHSYFQNFEEPARFLRRSKRGMSPLIRFRRAKISGDSLSSPIMGDEGGLVWRSTMSRYLPLARISSSWRPCSIIRPFSMTRIRSACAIVLRRWAMTKLVRPQHQGLQIPWISRSDSVSRLLVASSRMRIFGSPGLPGRSLIFGADRRTVSHRARRSTCRNPPEASQ